MKKYSNYLEQVEANVTDLELFNELYQMDDNANANARDAIDTALLDSEIIDDEGLPADTDTTTTDFRSLRESYIDAMMDSLYQSYKVTLANDDYTSEHERLMIFYSKPVDAWILPVFHFGTAWSHVGAV